MADSSMEQQIKTRQEVIALAPFFAFKVVGVDTPVTMVMLEESCKGLKAYTYTTYIVSIIYPLISFVPFLVMTFINTCLNYTGGLYITLLSLSMLSFATSFVHLWIYNSLSVFCNERMVNIHNIHTVVLFSFLSATLGFYNLYSIDPNFLYVLAFSVTSFITVIEYFVCMFQRRHLYMCTTANCKDETKDNVLCFKRSKDAMNAMGVLFIFSWSGMMISTIILQSNLYVYTIGDQRPADTCTPLI